MTEPLSPVLPASDLPPTERLYWSQPQGRTFTATVTAVNGQQVTFDRTLFYPEGGGQSCDAGTLNWEGGSSQVSDVQKTGDTIWHTLEGQPPTVGSRVTGTLDWERRYRHSQRHTAEHLLAQAFWRVNPAFGVRSVGMRGPECTLDLAGQPEESHVQAAQVLLTGALREGLSLETVLVPADALDAYPLRRPPQVSGQARVVLFREPGGAIWEASACGGTHLPTGVQAAPVVVLKTERVKNDLTRVTFMAGEEATERLSGVYAQAQALARSFSVGVERLTGVVNGQRAELTATGHRLTTTHRELASQALKQATWHKVPGGEAALVQPGDTLSDLPQLEQDELVPHVLELAAQRPDCVVVVLAPDGGCGVASSLPQSSARTLLNGWLAQSGGRGGGRPELARGATERPDDFRSAVQDWLDALPCSE